MASIYNIGVSLANVQSFNIQRRTEDIRMLVGRVQRLPGSTWPAAAPNYTGAMSVGSAVAETVRTMART